ncbi:MAG TPA: alpha/beta hydrolase-fold protein [Egibacteraceae bacterium]|nr:alpha/beta hydrolase-fold protein [Egibacteraceae bacterium]
MRRIVLAGSRVAALCLVLAALGALPSAAEEFAPECAPPGEPMTVVVGRVECQRLHSEAMGAVTAFSYYVPPACDPALGRRCPVLYYTHGTGGSYREGTQPAWVRALTSGPPVDPRTVADPWRYGDLSTWVPQPALDLVIVAPHGRTVPGGHGPFAGVDTGWFDWNPRYAQGGDSPRYDTPPPRASEFLLDELLPYVEANLPVSGEREGRAILGYSQGGFGAYINGLTRPDLFASLGMRSGGGLPLAAPADAADPALPAPPPALPGALAPVRLPGLLPLVPAAVHQRVDPPLTAEVAYGWGDPVADQAWMRGANPVDLIPNARAYDHDGRQVVHLKHFVNDAVPRRQSDLTNPNVFAQFYESALYPMNLYMERVFDRYGVERDFRVGPGDHSGTYGVPYFREQLAEQYARLRHWDGGGRPPPRPVRFDYRTVRSAFSVWGWSFAVEREAMEFLNLTDVSCDGLTLRGSGSVTVTVPARCAATGPGGERTFTVDLGPSQPADEPAGMGQSSAYGRVVRVTLERRGNGPAGGGTGAGR